MKRSMRVRKKRKMLKKSLRLSKTKKDCRKLKNSFQRHSLCQKKRFNNNSKLKLHKLRKRKNQKRLSGGLRVKVQKAFLLQQRHKNTNSNQTSRFSCHMDAVQTGFCYYFMDFAFQTINMTQLWSESDERFRANRKWDLLRLSYQL